MNFLIKRTFSKINNTNRIILIHFYSILGNILLSGTNFRPIKLKILKDQRYYAIKSLIETKRINSLKEVFKIIPLSVVRVDMKANYSTLRKRVYNGDSLTLKDFRLMGDLFEVDPTEVFQLAILDVKDKAVNDLPKKKMKSK